MKIALLITTLLGIFSSNSANYGQGTIIFDLVPVAEPQLKLERAKDTTKLSNDENPQEVASETRTLLKDYMDRLKKSFTSALSTATGDIKMKRLLFFNHQEHRAIFNSEHCFLSAIERHLKLLKSFNGPNGTLIGISNDYDFEMALLEWVKGMQSLPHYVEVIRDILHIGILKASKLRPIQVRKLFINMALDLGRICIILDDHLDYIENMKYAVTKYFINNKEKTKVNDHTWMQEDNLQDNIKTFIDNIILGNSESMESMKINEELNDDDDTPKNNYYLNGLTDAVKNSTLNYDNYLRTPYRKMLLAVVFTNNSSDA